MKIIAFSDGAARGNPGHAGIGGIILNGNGEILVTVSEYVGERTNNVSEYLAFIVTLERAIELNPTHLDLRIDSELLVRQIKGIYKVKNQGLAPLYKRSMQLLSGCDEYELSHVPREENRDADRLANEAIDRFLEGESSIYTIAGMEEQTSLFNDK